MLKRIKGIELPYSNKLKTSCRMYRNGGGMISIGNNNDFGHGVLLMTYGGQITIGSNCNINPYTIIYGHGEGVKIGDNVLIAGHCMIIPFNHKFEMMDTPINVQGDESKGIMIGNDVWIGAGVKILDGTKVGDGAVIAAGAVVVGDVSSYSVFAGVPAKFKRYRNEVR